MSVIVYNKSIMYITINEKKAVNHYSKIKKDKGKNYSLDFFRDSTMSISLILRLNNKLTTMVKPITQTNVIIIVGRL